MVPVIDTPILYTRTLTKNGFAEMTSEALETTALIMDMLTCMMKQSSTLTDSFFDLENGAAYEGHTRLLIDIISEQITDPLLL